MKRLGITQLLLSLLLIISSHSAWSVLAIDDNYVIPQDDPGYPIDPLANDIIQISSLQPLVAGNFILQAGQGTITVNQGSVILTPAPGFQGQLEFAYTITDVTGTDSAKITANIQASPAPHQAVNDFHHVLQNDFAIGFNVLANDNYNATNGVQIVAVSTTVQGGIVAIDPTGQFVTYQPPANYTGLDSFTYDLQDLVTSVISQGTITVFVGINPGQNPPIAGATPEEQGTIDIIDQICNDTPNGPLPCTLIATLSDTERQSLAQQVGGRHAKAQSRAVQQIKNRQTTNVRSRLSEIRGQRNRVSINNLNTALFNESVPLAQAFQPIINNTLTGGSAGDGDLVTPWGMFINGNVSFGEGMGPSDKPQYEQDGFNITTGADYRFNDKVVIGSALGYSQSNLDFSFNRGTQNSDSYTLSLFGNYYPWKQFYVDFLVMWINADIDIERRINVATFSQTLSSNTSSTQSVAATSFGYEFSFNAWQGAIFARAEYSDLSIDGYTESGSGTFELQVNDQESDNIDIAFGGRIAYVVPWRSGIVIPSFELESVSQGEEELEIQSRFAQVPTGQAISLDGAVQDDTYYNASLSLSAVWSGGRSGFFRYETVLDHDEYENDTFSLGFRFEF